MRTFSFFSAVLAILAFAGLAASCTKPYEPDLDAPWSVLLESLDSARTQVRIHSSKAGEPARVVRQGKKVDVVYEKIGGKDVDVTISYLPSKECLQVIPSVTNRENGYVALEFHGPFMEYPCLNTDEMDLLIPAGVGVRYHFPKAEAGGSWKEDKKHGCLVGTFNYPGMNCNMQWAEFTGAGKNLYFASHDPQFRWKEFIVKYYPETRKASFAFGHHFTCFAGESYTCPETRIQWLDGDWKAGSKVYSAWFHEAHKMPVKPEWVTRSNGWLLTILKQQNDEIMWNYEEMGTKMVDIAEARGLDIIGFFGWTVGGHDRFYPEYDPDPRMGGEEGLKEAVRKIHERGLKAVFYFNGQLIDQNGTQFWPDTGRFITTVAPDGKHRYERWWKYADIEPRIHGLACQSSEIWRNRLLNLTKKVYAYGADGVIYDQLGTRAPMLCYGEGHGHKVPAVVYEQDRAANLEFLNTEMRKIDPDFLIITEGIEDCEVNTGVSMFHGCSASVRQSTDYPENIRNAYSSEDKPFFTVFPDMFHYTIPEADFTVRTPTPASTHNSLNFSTVFGYKHEIETRYLPDKLYLTDDRIPAWSEYDNIKGRKPLYSTLEEQDPKEVAAYSHAVLAFRKKHADILYDGNFRSDEGFTLSSASPNVIARSFVNGAKMGVVVWNISDDQPVDFTVTPDKGWKLIETDAPEGTPAEGALPAQTLRLLVFERDR
ncbi:MAG: hypothetical protein IKH49_02040 [Bacteroidales bacterium]|nr:hypothetical protein [Bacteroidales bacterium]